MALPNLKDKIAFITGAASGIGAATARAFAAQGCVLVLADLDEAGLVRTSTSVTQAGAKVHVMALDVTDEAQYKQLAQKVCASVGVPHIVINNAGIGAHGSFLNTPMDVVRRIININVYGVYNGCHAFLPMMLEAGDSRHLVNVASMASIAPMPNMSAYAASKYAVDGLTEVLAMELLDTNVDVTCVHPGVINTPIAQGVSHNGEAGVDQVRRLGEYYQAHGSDPAVVAQGMVKAVKKGIAHLHIGKKANLTEKLKRISPTLLRKLAMKTATEVGYS